MFPTVTPPEKNIHGSQERMYKKSGDVYLQQNDKTHYLMITDTFPDDFVLHFHNLLKVF